MTSNGPRTRSPFQNSVRGDYFLGAIAQHGSHGWHYSSQTFQICGKPVVAEINVGIAHLVMQIDHGILFRKKSCCIPQDSKMGFSGIGAIGRAPQEGSYFERGNRAGTGLALPEENAVFLYAVLLQHCFSLVNRNPSRETSSRPVNGEC
jgi:hypothetical protein